MGSHLLSFLSPLFYYLSPPSGRFLAPGDNEGGDIASQLWSGIVIFPVRQPHVISPPISSLTTKSLLTPHLPAAAFVKIRDVSPGQRVPLRLGGPIPRYDCPQGLLSPSG